ncbi:SDR family oxidoreductase [Caldilinea sp.]|uniref:SDR family oxidoreductase n=1 Tax=Caldilinea sp. TaxID=2293560 RepID=UPI002C05BEAE|nr:SDR family oxidoreductase [Anaerolineales bacterium]HQY91761.1 SDR family oxidoreductase [Caldilinea sp.]HRA65289.1 SDR family oxidoreductase [Caldilinea sp.]
MSAWTLAGKRALITGGSKGIGLAAADEFLALGADVLIVARGEQELQRVVAARVAQGLLIAGVAADVGAVGGRAAIMEAVHARWDGLDILVNNAGTNIRRATVDYALEQVVHLIDVNLLSAYELTRALYPLLRQGAGPAVVNVASVAGMLDVGSGSPYALTKAALIQVTRSLAGEWAGAGIRVNVVSPWYTETPLAMPVLQDAERLDRILQRTPLARIATADEVAAAIAFLAMDKASYITGANLVVDGGMTIKGL